jgi:hypothetical protein
MRQQQNVMATCVFVTSSIMHFNVFPQDLLSTASLEKAHSHSKMVVLSCSDYALESVEELMLPLETALTQEQMASRLDFYKDLLDEQTRLCLRIMSLKLREAADAIK